MNLSKENEEKVVLAIQAVLGIVIIILSVMNSAKTQSAQLKKVLDKDARNLGKLHKKEYLLQKKLTTKKYKAKIKKLKAK